MRAIPTALFTLGLAAACLPAWADGGSDQAAAPKIRFEGYVESYFSYRLGSTQHDTNALRVYDTDNLSFVPAFAKLSAIMDPGPVGFRMDLGFGPIADITSFDYIPATGNDPLAPGTTAASAVFKHLEQAYLTWKLPTSFPLVLDAGKFVTSGCAEVAESLDNWNYSRSYLFGWGPFTHTGVRLTSPLSDKLTLQASLVNGWDWAIDNNGMKTVGLNAVWIAPFGTTFALTTYQGPEGAATANWRQLYDLVLSHDFTDRLHAKAEGTWGADSGFAASKVPGGSWYGGAGYLRYDVLPQLYLAGRLEYFGDPQGVRMGLTDSSNATVTPSILAGTLTAGMPITKNAELRLEVRHDRELAGKPVFDNRSQSGQTTLQAAAMARF